MKARFLMFLTMPFFYFGSALAYDYNHKVKAYIDFNEKKMWFHNENKDRILIATNGSVLELDKGIVGGGEVKIYGRQSTFRWLFLVSNKEPLFQDYIEIKGFQKVKNYMNKEGSFKLKTVFFKIGEDYKMEGPLISQMIDCYPVPQGGILKSTFDVHKIDLDKLRSEHRKTLPKKTN